MPARATAARPARGQGPCLGLGLGLGAGVGWVLFFLNWVTHCFGSGYEYEPNPNHAHAGCANEDHPARPKHTRF